MKDRQQSNHHKQRLTPNGTRFEFLASPDEAEAEICLIRGTVPPGTAVPLHSHPDVEIFYVVEGSAECFQLTNGTSRWTTVDAGDVVTGGGVSLCIDTMLHLLQRLFGPLHHPISKAVLNGAGCIKASFAVRLLTKEAI